jgi:hypothetical protein
MINKFTIITALIVVLGYFGYNKYYLQTPVSKIIVEKKQEIISYSFIDTSSTKSLLFPDTDWKVKYTYKNIGTINEGKYQGYNRILVIEENYISFDNKEYRYYLFATNDNKKFIFNSNTSAGLENIYLKFTNPENITYDWLQTNIPAKIDVDENYLLSQNLSYFYTNYDNFVDIDSEIKSREATGDTTTKLKINNYDLVYFNKYNQYYINDGGLYVRYILEPKFKSRTNLIYSEKTSDLPSKPYGFTFKSYLRPDIKFKSYEIYYSALIALSDMNVVEMKDSEVEFLTDELGPKIYRIKQINSPNLEEIVSRYLSRISLDNKNIDKKELENNIKNGAILLMKNPFGKYIVLFEKEKTQPVLGGGKPVIYLYPKTEQKVSLKFDKPMLFNNIVPNYINEWEVLANPNGILKDLKPELTNCSSIKITTSTTYAKDACVKNEYPYLYWSGGVFNSYIFPKNIDGFVVANSELAKFFDEKLSFIGFNEKEISDFKEFWVPELQSKNKNYFTIRFLQNEELDQLFPMTISPKPDSKIRIFMDWNGYDQKPDITKQNLIKYNRNGFVITEWGGFKK